ncbi:MAG TPA: flavin reductase family protein [Caulobacteraceae bacterium]|nr:flavin reductase family protein [Caulobacteraceae bacterium]
MAADPTLPYRAALSAFATGVTVVVAEDETGPVGLTVNSLASVSLEPRLVLWCLGDECDRRALFGAADRFTINVLAAEDMALCERFAWGDARLEPHEVRLAPSGASGLKGALTILDCQAHTKIGLGDHMVIVGRVMDFETRPGDGLLFFRGGYGRAST